MVTEIWRVLEPDGLLILVSHNGKRLKLLKSCGTWQCLELRRCRLSPQAWNPTGIFAALAQKRDTVLAVGLSTWTCMVQTCHAKEQLVHPIVRSIFATPAEATFINALRSKLPKGAPLRDAIQDPELLQEASEEAKQALRHGVCLQRAACPKRSSKDVLFGMVVLFAYLERFCNIAQDFQENGLHRCLPDLQSKERDCDLFGCAMSAWL